MPIYDTNETKSKEQNIWKTTTNTAATNIKNIMYLLIPL